MITAIDSNVLFDILAPDPEYFALSSQAVEDAANAGSLVICDLVYVELCSLSTSGRLRSLSSGKRHSR
jgi:predicted nucleic-acid-binding protein